MSKVLIVGGVAGGASAAARLRRNDEFAEIIVFEKGEYISFANCGLPYYIGGAIDKRQHLLLQTPKAMKDRFNIDVRVKNEVVSIDRKNKTVEVLDHGTGNRYVESYDKLVLSPGSTPIRPQMPGLDSPNVFSLWNIPDTDAIKGYIDTVRPKTAIVVGGGFIGLEMVENLHALGLEVTLVQNGDQVLAPLDKDMADQLHRHIESKCARLILGNRVSEFIYSEKGTQNPEIPTTTAVLGDGERIQADIIIFSIGIVPNSGLAKNAGLDLNERGGIKVNDYLETNDPDIYAVGDVIEVTDFMSREKSMKPLAGPANKQGRMAADNICGAGFKFNGTQGTSIAKVFDLTAANTGLNEKQLIEMGKKLHVDYEFALIHSKSHAGYYPGALGMAIKLIFDMAGKVLGAQIVGYDGVDKRIDVIAASMRFGATVYDLTELELAYAPPFSSAKDPVNMVGYVSENILKGTVKPISTYELKGMMGSKSEDFVVIDVRDEIETHMGAIAGSVNIAVNDLRSNLERLEKEYGKGKKIIVQCAIGLRGYIGARILMQHGFTDVYNLQGGYTSWSQMESKIDYVDIDRGDVETNEDGSLENMENEDDNVSNKIAGVEFPNAKTFELNACGLQCPGPIAQVYSTMEMMECGDILKIKATDAGFASDIGVWCKRTGNTLIESGKQDSNFFATIRKGTDKTCPVSSSNVKISFENCATGVNNVDIEMPNDKTMVVFSGDLDKAIASLIIANGAASMGRKVTMFFTFWGLNVLRKHEGANVKKDIVSRMFSMMMPRGTKKLGLSKMHMAGMGPMMIRWLMKEKNVDSLETLMKSAMDSGVKMIACNMSMDLMGIKEEELIDGIDFGGVATYLGAAEEADVNLFI